MSKTTNGAGSRTARVEVTEVEGEMPRGGTYEFVIFGHNGRDGNGWRVGAKGPRGEVETTVYGDVTRETIIGARFYRS